MDAVRGSSAVLEEVRQTSPDASCSDGIARSSMADSSMRWIVSATQGQNVDDVEPRSPPVTMGLQT